MTWEEFGELKAWIDLAKLMLDSARRALENDDDSLFRKFVQQTQDALCEAVAAHDKAYKLELDRLRGYCVEATTGKGMPIAVELLETEAEE